ncbi:hypothetical protein L873DRAFT_1794030 [Choiromyces venosus 120613-1]|uniref:Uncharacterized protein n=1 Tax=Choiromyces venosus 120613-1 TaxID=1336337 RepID=A0A3N4J6V4_9PEZI|nr:hypothetical protein L873DRAFT_1794030 [Choiromyces venosus 120613-1]
MFFQRFIAFLLMALMPLLALAETTGSAPTTTVRNTVYSTQVTYVTMTGSPPAGATGTGNVTVTNSTITSISSPAKPTTSQPPSTGAAAGTFRFSSGLAGAAIVAAVVGLL